MAINQDVELTVCQLRESDDSLATDYQASATVLPLQIHYQKPSLNIPCFQFTTAFFSVLFLLHVSIHIVLKLLSVPGPLSITLQYCIYMNAHIVRHVP